MAKIINGSVIYNALANYLATNAHLNDTAQDVLCMVAKWIDEAPEIDSPKWIPVTERLPNAHDSCIVYRKGTFGHFSMLRYTPTLGFHFYDLEWGDVTVDNVTHWMPLPEPPKEVEL